MAAKTARQSGSFAFSPIMVVLAAMLASTSTVQAMPVFPAALLQGGPPDMPRTFTALVMRPRFAEFKQPHPAIERSIPGPDVDMDCGMDQSENWGPPVAHMGLPGIVPTDRSHAQDHERSPVARVNLVRVLRIGIKLGRHEEKKVEEKEAEDEAVEEKDAEDEAADEEDEVKSKNSVEEKHERSSSGLEQAMTAMAIMMAGNARRLATQPESQPDAQLESASTNNNKSGTPDEFKILGNTSTKVDLRK